MEDRQWCLQIHLGGSHFGPMRGAYDRSVSKEVYKEPQQINLKVGESALYTWEQDWLCYAGVVAHG